MAARGDGYSRVSVEDGMVHSPDSRQYIRYIQTRGGGTMRLSEYAHRLTDGLDLLEKIELWKKEPAIAG